MIATRNAHIKASHGRVTVFTFPEYPFLHLLKFVGILISWLVGTVFVILGLSGALSPESMTNGIRTFLIIWLILWLTGGAFTLPGSFMTSFSTINIEADATGVIVRKKFPFGQQSQKYLWSDLKYISNYIIDGRAYGGVVLHVRGRVLKIDERLPNRVAEKISRSIESIWPA